MWRPIRVVPTRIVTNAAVLVILSAVLLAAGCDMPSLEDLDEPKGDSTLTLLPSTVNVVVGAEATFTASGGKAPYVFEANDGVVTVVNSTTVTFTPPAQNTYIVSVTDADGTVCEATVMATATVPLSVSPASITVEAGTTVHLIASGGGGGFWFEKITGTGALTTISGTEATYRAVNTESARIRLHDDSESVDAVLTITDPPTLELTPMWVTLDPNTQITFTATGGTGGYVYSNSYPLRGSINPSTGVYTALTAGGDTVTVTDSGGRTIAPPATIIINSPTTQVRLSPANIHVGVGKTVTFTASYGTPDYTYTLTGAGSISPSGTTSSPSTTYTAPLVEGNGITITVKDGLSNTDFATITVDPPPPLQINPGTISLTTNEGVTFTATGGTAGYRYSVVTGTGTINPTTGLFTAPAVEETDTVRVTDSGGRTCDATVNVYFPLTIVPTDAFVATNDAYTFSASGGKEAYHYYLTSGGGSIGDSSGVYSAPGSAGPATVQVLDALGNASYATVTVYSPTWTIQSVDTVIKSGQFASLALDPLNDYPRVAYYDSQGKQLRLASWNGTSWTSQVVDSAGTVGQYCSLALDANTGYPRISYYDSSNRNLKYAAWDGSKWSVKAVDSGGTVGQYTSLALDPTTGHPRISYYDASSQCLKFASWNGTAWEVRIVDQTPGKNVGMYSSLALDPATSWWPRICYYDQTSQKLKYAAWNGSAWLLSNPDNATQRGEYCSLALDPSTGYPRISYYNRGAKRLWYAWYDGTWHTQEVDSSAKDRGMYSSIALASSPGHHPRISYYDATDKKLVYTLFNGSTWSPPLQIDIASNVGQYASLRLSSDGRAVIAYYASSSQDLKVARE